MKSCSYDPKTKKVRPVFSPAEKKEYFAKKVIKSLFDFAYCIQRAWGISNGVAQRGKQAVYDAVMHLIGRRKLVWMNKKFILPALMALLLLSGVFALPVLPLAIGGSLLFGAALGYFGYNDVNTLTANTYNAETQKVQTAINYNTGEAYYLYATSTRLYTAKAVNELTAANQLIPDTRTFVYMKAKYSATMDYNKTKDIVSASAAALKFVDDYYTNLTKYWIANERMHLTYLVDMEKKGLAGGYAPVLSPIFVGHAPVSAAINAVYWEGDIYYNPANISGETLGATIADGTGTDYVMTHERPPYPAPGHQLANFSTKNIVQAVGITSFNRTVPGNYPFGTFLTGGTNEVVVQNLVLHTPAGSTAAAQAAAAATDRFNPNLGYGMAYSYRDYTALYTTINDNWNFVRTNIGSFIDMILLQATTEQLNTLLFDPGLVLANTRDVGVNGTQTNIMIATELALLNKSVPANWSTVTFNINGTEYSGIPAGDFRQNGTVNNTLRLNETRLFTGYLVTSSGMLILNENVTLKDVKTSSGAPLTALDLQAQINSFGAMTSSINAVLEQNARMMALYEKAISDRVIATSAGTGTGIGGLTYTGDNPILAWAFKNKAAAAFLLLAAAFVWLGRKKK